MLEKKKVARIMEVKTKPGYPLKHPAKQVGKILI